MAYIGNKSDTAFTSLEKQDFSNPSGTSLTLTHAVANANDIALYINNVRQEPTEAYSVNGTTVTLTGSVSNSDDIYAVYLARAVQTTVPPDGSVSTAKIANSAVDLTSKVTGVLPYANGGNQTASMASYKWAALDQNNSNTTIPCSSITVNIGSDLASNGRYTCPVGGVYRATIFGMAGVAGGNSNSGTFEVYLSLNDAYPSDAQYKKYVDPAATYSHFSANILISCSANDTLEWGILANTRTLHADYGQATFKLEHQT